MITALFSVAFSLPVVRADSRPGDPIHLREIHVPYEEFASRAAADPHGVVMRLDEYRSLLLEGLRRSRKDPPPPLPPIDAVVTRAEHRGELTGSTARFRSTLHVRATRENWMRCDLGRLPAALGSVLVDGEPGWILREVPRPGPQSQGKARMQAPPQPHSYLVLRGSGEHLVEITFSLPATKTEDLWTVAGTLPRAATAWLVLEVPGRAEARSDPPFLHTTPVEGTVSTALHLALGTAERFAINWRQKRAAGESGALLAADHRLTLLPRRGDPVFVWEAAVTVRRQKTELLEFQEPPGAEVVRVSGARVHSWERDESSVRVLLAEPVLGELKVRFEGFIKATALPEEVRRFDVGAPALGGAYSQSGYMAILDPVPERLEIEAVEAAEEVALGEGQVPALGPAPVARLFSFATLEARVRFQTLPRPSAFAYRAACLARILESATTLDALYSIHVVRGRLYHLRLSLPAPWRIESLLPAAAEGAAPPRLSYEVAGPGEERVVEITLERALDRAKPLDLRLGLAHGGWETELGWERRELELRLPVLDGAERARVDLGIAVAGSMDAESVEQGAWRRVDRQALRVPEPGRRSEENQGLTLVTWKSLDSQRLKEVGLEVPQLAAGLSSTTPEEPISITLRRKPSRGEYQAVSYVLALERHVRVRSDIQLTLSGRPLEEVRLRLPVSPDITVPILAPGIKEDEMVEDEVEGGSLLTVRFEKPWIGSRRLRLEYEVEHSPGIETPIPALEVLGPANVAANFSGDRGIVFQSIGPVELIAETGSGLLPATVEELPDLGQPWKGGRLLSAHRFHGEGDPGSFMTRLHQRFPVLSTMARELSLTTVLGSSGVSRTRAELLLAYADRERLDVRLTSASRLLSVEVDGEPVRAVWRGDESEDGSSWSIPLPPRSYAHLVLVYDNSRIERDDLGGWGEWLEVGPRFPGEDGKRAVPVGSCRWRLYHPHDFRFHIDEGESNLLALEPQRRVTSFAASFFGRLLSGKLPLFTSFDDEQRSRPLVPPALPQLASAGAAATRARPTSGGLGQLASRRAAYAQAATPERAAPGVGIVAEGILLEAAKIGGEPQLVLSYRSYHWWNFSKRAVFLLTLLGGLALALRGGRRWFYRCVLWGLFGGTLLPLLPLGIGWESPFLLIPFCEGLVTLLVAAAALNAGRAAGSLLTRIAVPRQAAGEGAPARAILLPFLLLALTGSSGGPLVAGEDDVLIPYDPEDLSTLDPTRQKVYLPYKKFRELWLLAHPEEALPEKPPADLVVGNASYELSLEGLTYRLRGEVALNVLTDDWLSLPLPFTEARLARVTLDGVELGTTTRDGTPVVAVRGRGRHRLGLELSGAVERQPGMFSIRTSILAGAATRLRAELPRGARARLRGAPAGATVEKGGEASGETVLHVELGSTPRLDLTWTFPQVAGEVASRLESLSYSLLELTTDGYRVERLEAVEVAGQPLDELRFRVLGDWEIAEVEAPELVEWSVAEDDGEKRLSIFFARPLERVVARIRGLARLPGEEAQAASLELLSAVRQESFVGLRHGARRRWHPEALAGARRVTPAELERALPQARGAPERLYQIHGSGEEETVAAVAVEGTVDLATDCVLAVGTERAVLSTRSRYQVRAPGPFRQELVLPAGWKVRAARGEKLRAWEAVPENGGTRLVFFLEGRAVSGTEVTWSAELEYETVPRPLTVPRLESTTAGQALRDETVRLAVAEAEGLKLSVAEDVGLAAMSLEGVRGWVRLPDRYSYRFAFRSTGSRPVYTLSLEAAAPAIRLRAVAVLFARPREGSVLVNGRLTYHVERGAMERFGFRLPVGAHLEALETRNQRSRELEDTAAGEEEVELTLVSPEFREQTVDISYSIAYGMEGDDPDAAVALTPPVLLGEGEQIEVVDYYLGLVQGARVLVTAGDTVNLTELPAERLPFLPQGLPSENLRPTYRATQADWRLMLSQVPVEAAEELDAFVALAEIATVLARDGTLRTRASYLLRNRRLQFLEVELPAGTRLWGVTVDGEPVLVSREEEGASGGGEADTEIREESGEETPGTRLLKVPLARVGPGDPDLELVLVYSQPRVAMPGLQSSFGLRAPRLPRTKVIETLWRLELPGGYAVSTTSSMQEVTASFRHARKVEKLLEQIDRLNVTAKKSESERLKQRAAVNLRRLEQALSDNVEELEETLDRPPEANVSRAEWAKQTEAGRKLLEQGRKQRDELRRDQLHQAEGQAAAGALERGLDGFRFLENDWRQGKEARGGAGAPARPSADAGSGSKRPTPRRQNPSAGEEFVDLEGLLGARPFHGLQGAAPRLEDRAVETAQPRPLEASGLPPVEQAVVSPITPGLETPPAREGQRALTFRRMGGDAALELTVRREGVMPRFGALALLVAVPAIFWWRRRARR